MAGLCEVCKILALYRLTSPSYGSIENLKVALFLFGSRSFLTNNSRFKVKLIDKAVVHVKIHKNERERLVQPIKKFF
jgi:hypothetical protein